MFVTLVASVQPVSNKVTSSPGHPAVCERYEGNLSPIGKSSSVIILSSQSKKVTIATSLGGASQGTWNDT